MSLRLQIKKWFNEAVALDTKHPRELKDKLKHGHPKLEMFFDNLTKQFLDAEALLKKKGVPLRAKTIQETVYQMADVFMSGMEGEARRMYETDLQRSIREAEANKTKEFEDVLAGKVKGTAFEDAGLITNEKIDSQREVGFNVK